LNLDNETIKKIVAEVVTNVIQRKAQPISTSATTDGKGIFPDINSAVKSARIAQQQLVSLKLEQRESIIRAIR